MTDEKEIPPLLRLGDSIAFLPIVNGSAQFSVITRRWLLEHDFDCLAVPLPPSFQVDVEAAVLELPKPSIVIQKPQLTFDPEGETPPTSYVPIDPCQSVITAIRSAMGEHIRREFIDLETDPFVPYATVMPDPFAVRTVAAEKFAAAVLPQITAPPHSRTRARMVYMASRLHQLETQSKRILIVDSVLHWPWIREAYNRITGIESADRIAGLSSEVELPEDDYVEATQRYDVDAKTLLFLFGELPFITSLYERARAELDDDEDLLIDGVKELLIASRETYRDELGNRGRKVTPSLLSKCLTYIRNLSLMHRRMTPDLITIVTAAKQIFGDAYALHVAENANVYAYADKASSPSINHDRFLALEETNAVKLGIDQARLPDGEVVSLVNRLPGPPLTWTTLELKRKPEDNESQRWKHTFNPYGQCSYPPEDERIESFRARVFERAQAMVGNELARTEKFTTSVKDGIDIRDTLRHWYEGQIYVRVNPPSRGTLDACVMIFDSPADPRQYVWRTTWFAEHKDESTLAFYATNYRDEIIGPNIAMATYGGSLFLYPPIAIPDIWSDKRLDYAETLEERLIAAACLYSRSKQIALLSPLPPGNAWRRIAKRYKKQLVHVPLSGFSDEQVQQMRIVHVLGGKEVRSYASEFIRRV